MIKPRSCMIYADSRIGKTTQLYFIAKYIFETYGKISRIIVGDPGGCDPFIDSGMVERGEVQLFDFSYRKLAVADFRRLSRGYWPISNSKGEEWFRTDDRCLTSPEDFNKIGAYMLDSMTSVGRLLLSHCSDQEGGLGFKEAYLYEEDGESIRGLQQGHYGIVQKEIYKLHAHGFAMLPIPYLIWTALVGKGEEKRDKQTKYGPQMAGNASTPEIPTWFGDTFHLEKIIETKEDGTSVEKRVAWFIEHPDRETGIPYICGPRLLPEIYREYLGLFKNGYVPLTLKSGIDTHYKVLEILNKKYREGKEGREGKSGGGSI